MEETERGLTCRAGIYVPTELKDTFYKYNIRMHITKGLYEEPHVIHVVIMSEGAVAAWCSLSTVGLFIPV